MTDSRVRLLERCLILGMLAAVLLSLGTVSRQHTAFSPDDLYQLKDGWYRMEGEEKIPVSVPGKVVLDGEEDLVIHYDRLTDAAGRHSVTMKGADYRPSIWLGDQLLYAYDDAGFPRNQQMRTKLYCDAILPDYPQGLTLSVQLENPGNGVFELKPIYAGRSGAILRLQFFTSAFTLILVLAMAIVAAGCTGAYFYLKNIHVSEPRLANAAWFLILCGTWSLLDSSLIQRLANGSPVVCMVSFYAFMTIVSPMLHFMMNTSGMGKYRQLKWFIGLFYINVIVQSAANLFFKVPFIAMLPITHLLQLVISVSATWLLWKEYRVSNNGEIRTVLESIGLLAGATAVDILLYWILRVPSYGLIFECGILIFIIRLLCAIADSMVASLRFKAEAQVYKRMSREDRLTGLGNRLGFDEFLTALETGRERCRDVALVFLDLNHLKRVNDTYGHQAGDELIVGAAGCVDRAFRSVGHCYRIGGDEFAVLIPEPTQSEEELRLRLEEQVQQYNQSNRYRLSIACGISYLQDADSHVKRFSDWKFEADQAMYRDKRRQKALEGYAKEEEST